jgi:hypothetical protein
MHKRMRAGIAQVLQPQGRQALLGVVVAGPRVQMRQRRWKPQTTLQTMAHRPSMGLVVGATRRGDKTPVLSTTGNVGVAVRG